MFLVSALITEAALGYSLSLPDWIYFIFILSFVVSGFFSIFRLLRSDDDK